MCWSEKDDCNAFKKHLCIRCEWNIDESERKSYVVKWK